MDNKGDVFILFQLIGRAVSGCRCLFPSRFTSAGRFGALGTSAAAAAVEGSPGLGAGQRVGDRRPATEAAGEEPRANEVTGAAEAAEVTRSPAPPDIPPRGGETHCGDDRGLRGSLEGSGRMVLTWASNH